MIFIKKVKREHLYSQRQIMRLNSECFPEDNRDLETQKKWLLSNAGPRNNYYVAFNDEKQTIGYILWKENGGFREEAILELEQIGVTETYRNQGVASKLIQVSLKDYIKTILEPQERTLKLVTLTTGVENEAQRLYKKVLGAEQVATLPDYYDGDELIMFARKDTIEKKLNF